LKQFSSIEMLDTGILYTLELASSVSVLLLAFGLIASKANDLPQDCTRSEFGHRMPLNERNHMVMPNAVAKHYAIVVMCVSGCIVSVWVSSSAWAL
jgi:hypothetical protein